MRTGIHGACHRARIRATRWLENALIKGGAARHKSVEVGRAITDAVRAGDEDLPALVNKGLCLGNSDGDAQADRRCGILAPRGVYDEGHGKPFLRDAFIDVTLRRPGPGRPAF